MLKPCIPLLVALGVSALIPPPASVALDIVNYNAGANDRFSSGYPNAPVPNNDPAFLGRGCDFSGVGWCATNPNQFFTMINDRQFVLASHYSPASGMVNFFSPATNSVVSYPIDPNGYINFTDSATGQKTDLQIGTLTRPLNPADRISTYPILKLARAEDYLNQKLLVCGHGAHDAVKAVVGIAWVASLQHADYYDANGARKEDGIKDTTVFSFKQGTVTGGAFGEAGDSAAPTFVPVNGTLCLLGTHADISANPNTTYDIFLPAYLGSLKKAGVAFKTAP